MDTPDEPQLTLVEQAQLTQMREMDALLAHSRAIGASLDALLAHMDYQARMERGEDGFDG